MRFFHYLCKQIRQHADKRQSRITIDTNKTMEQTKVDSFLALNGSKFPESHLPYIREKLLAADDSRWEVLSRASFKDPIIALVLSLLVGVYGVDRFYTDDIGLGVGKLLTGAGCGIWLVIDWFFIMGAAREANYKKLFLYLA